MLNRLGLVAVAALIVCTAASGMVQAAPRIDPSFGKEGLVQSEFGSSYTKENFTSIERQTDGSILATLHQGEGESRFRRFDPDGTTSKTSPPEARTEGATAVDEEGRTLRAIYGGLERINANGTPDQGFGVKRSGSVNENVQAPFGIEQILSLPSGKFCRRGNYRI